MVRATVPPKLMAVVDAPLHNACGETVLIVGVGLTVIVKLVVVPVHPLLIGVTIIVHDMGDVPGLVAENAGMFPEPLAPSPIAVLEFAQLKVVPATVPDKFIKLVVEPLHNVRLDTLLTVGVGLTVTANELAALLQVAVFAITIIFPLVRDAVVDMEFVVEPPVQPPGNVQV